METPAAAVVEVVGGSLVVLLPPLVVVVGATVRTEMPVVSMSPPLHAAAATTMSANNATRERSLGTMTAASFADVLWIVFIGAVLVGLLILSRRRVEPHWTSKDGRAFLCRVQELGPDGGPTSGWYEARAKVLGESVLLKPRLLTHRSAAWDARTVLHRAPDHDSPFAVYLLEGNPGVLLRVPNYSEAVHVLDDLLIGGSGHE
jgi:hypothetical protein